MYCYYIACHYNVTWAGKRILGVSDCKLKPAFITVHYEPLFVHAVLCPSVLVSVVLVRFAKLIPLKSLPRLNCSVRVSHVNLFSFCSSQFCCVFLNLSYVPLCSCCHWPRVSTDMDCHNSVSMDMFLHLSLIPAVSCPFISLAI